jgi:uncharacterized protein involved in response to NO
MKSAARVVEAVSSKSRGQDRAYRGFFVAALALAVFGGFVLAIVLPIDAATGFSLGERWPALAQAHGHLQAIGFAGLIIIGIALRLAPRFASRPLAYPQLTPLILGLVLAGVVVRSASQPYADSTAGHVFAVAGGALELLGAICFIVSLWATVLPTLRTQQSFTPFFLAGSFWFLVQAALSLAWLADLEGGTTIPAVRNDLLVAIQFFGFHAAFVLGVGTRAFPVFFGVEDRDWRPAWLLCGAVQSGLLALLGARLYWISSGDAVWLTEGLAFVTIAGGLALTTVLTGFWHPATGIRQSARSTAWLLRLTLAWLIVACAALSWFAVQAVGDESVVTHIEMDAVRHIVALGVVTMAIIGMGHMILPELATERLSAGARARRVYAFGAALSLAVVLRAFDGLAGSPLSNDARNWMLAVSGMIGLAVVAAFALVLFRAARREPLLLQEVAERVTPTAPVATVGAGERPGPATG